MQLPDNSVGITDIIAYRECPRRFSFGMRRHTGRAEQSDDRNPEKNVYGAVWATSYGSAIHDAIQGVEDGLSDDDAIQRAWDRWGHHLDPPDLDLLREDLETYRRRDFAGTKALAVEDEFRIPLFEHEGETIYFRFKLDRLYQRLDNPGVFIHVDYKSSRHAKSEADVHKDEQMWAYNLGIHDYFPECFDLIQVYDQLRYGTVVTRKSDDQREQMREWLIRNVKAILADEQIKDDGLMTPRFNQWCPWCPLLESCSVVGELSDWSRTRISALAPRRPKLKKDGTPGKQMENVPLERERLPEYVTELDKAKTALTTLERFRDSVNALLRDLPAEDRLALGYDLRPRNDSVFADPAKSALYQRLGHDRFMQLAKITKTALEGNIVEDEDLLEWALSLADRVRGTPSVVPVTY